MTNKPLLSIIIVSYNTCQITLDCLKSVFADKGLEFDLDKINQNEKIPTEIIVVDNNSPDNSVKELKKLKYITLIANKNNPGFGGGNNQAIKISKGNYILLLNPDTIILHSAISQSLNWLSAHPEAHMCTAQLLNKDLSIQASGGSFPNLLNTVAWSLGLDDLPFFNSIVPAFHPHTPQFYTHEKFYLNDHQQDWVTGAFMLIRRSIVDITKGFDEGYFMYGEEVEWAYRMHLVLPKSQCWYLVGPQIIHLGGASAIKKSDPIVREYTGVIAFFERHRPKWQTVVVKKILKLNAFLRSLVIPIYKEVCSRI
jgi:GT2 family glycosyltransferase